jgi:hypothetical protein
MEKLPARTGSRLPHGSPLDSEPVNELGVIYIFAHLARKRYGLRIDRIQSGFPDCLGFRDGKRVRIEFEYRSRNFAAHRHDATQCDWLVCWIHDWPAAPPNLRIIELRREYGLGCNVWFQPVAGKYSDESAEMNNDDRWSAPPQAIKGDLLLFYRATPESFVQDIFRVTSDIKLVRARWKSGNDTMASIKRVCKLPSPIHFSDMRDDRVLKHAGFVRGRMRTRYRATEYWPDLYRMIVARNPKSLPDLRHFTPQRFVF